MIIQLKKFGTTLISRPSGKEAYLAFQPTLGQVPKTEKITVDFDGVLVLTPSWADEFITPLTKQFPGQVVLQPSSNPTVRESLAMIV